MLKLLINYTIKRKTISAAVAAAKSIAVPDAAMNNYKINIFIHRLGHKLAPFFAAFVFIVISYCYCYCCHRKANSESGGVRVC